MAILDRAADFGMKVLGSKASKVALGVGIGYATTSDRFKPHPIKATEHGTSILMTGEPDMWDNMWGAYRHDLVGPMVGGTIFPNAVMPEFQWGYSALSHENLSARYGGPNPNSDAALFQNNFDNETGVYTGPTVGRSTGAQSSAMNLGANGSMVFGMWNNRLKG